MLVRLKKGYDIPIEGESSHFTEEISDCSYVGLEPSLYLGIKPKLQVKEKDQLLIGDVVFFDKKNPDVKILSPVSGSVDRIVYGAKRSILEVIIKKDGEQKYKEFNKFNKEQINKLSQDKVKNLLLESGLFAEIVNRPFGYVPSIDIIPRDIFISAYLTKPLASDIKAIVDGQLDNLQIAIDALKKVTSGDVYLSLGKDDNYLDKLLNCKINRFEGKHPAGNVGIQIHHIKPINKGDNIWTLDIATLVDIGSFLLNGKYPNKRIISLAGELVEKQYRKHYKVTKGQQISEIINGKYNKDVKSRIIDGDILSGKQKTKDNFLGNNNIVIIPEVIDSELFGWMNTGINKSSFSKTFFSKLMPFKRYSFNTGVHGGIRNLVQTSSYQKVVPMDILPVFLLKSILYKDIEEMEQLGILEVIEEDFALCDYICVSKTEVQQILRQGLNLYYKEVQ